MLENIWVIVVHYNGEQWITQCLDSLKIYAHEARVVVVDNNSPIKIGVDIIKKQYPEVHLLESKENIGFGRANNLGIALALQNNASHVFLLNQDAWILPNCLEQLYHVAQEYPEYGLISPIHFDSTQQELDGGFAHYVWQSTGLSTKEAVCATTHQKLYELAFVNAAGWFISQKCLDIVGGFDELFFMYGEDVDYINRVKYHQFKVGFTPLAHICHDRENRSKKVNPKELSISEQFQVKGQLLALLKNINYSFVQAIFMFGFHSHRLIWTEIKRGYFKRAVLVFKQVWRLLAGYPAIAKSNRQNRQKTRLFKN